VHEHSRGKTVWKGQVEVFDLIGHPMVKRCFAWSNTQGQEDENERFVVVLEKPPVIGPATAVRLSIANYCDKK
jgi:hypothetical protein